MMSIISSSPDISADRRKSFLQNRIAPIGQVLLLTWKKNRSLSIIALILMVIALPVLTLLSSYDNRLDAESLYMIQTVLMVPLMIIMTMVSAIMSFSYLHSRTAIDVMHALPVRRFPLLAGRFLGGLLPVLVAQWIAYGLFTLESTVTGIVQGINIFEILSVMGKLQLMTVAVYAVCVLAFFLSGTLFDAIMMMFFLNGAWPLTVLTLNYQLSSVLPGFRMNDSGLADLALFLSPWARSFVLREMDANMIISWLVIIAAVMIWTIWLNQRRPSELAGRSYAIRPPVWLMQWIACLLGGLLMGQLFYEMQQRPAMFIPGVVVGMIAAYLVIEAMVSRGLKSLLRSLPRLAVLAVIMAAGMTAVSLGAFGFVERVPKAEDVKSVQFMISDLPNYGNGYGDSGDDKTIFRTVENINSVISIHQTALDQISGILSAPYSIDSAAKLDRMYLDRQVVSAESKYSDYSYNFETVDIVYLLKNGRKMERSYRLPLSDAIYNNSLEPMKETTEYKLLKYPMLSDYPMLPDYLTVLDKLGESRIALNNIPQDMTELQAALREDLLTDTSGQPSEIYGSLNMQFTYYNANILLSDRTPAVMEALRRMSLYKDEFEQSQSAYASLGIFRQAPEIIRQRMSQITANNSQLNTVHFDPYMIGEMLAETGNSLEDILVEVDDQAMINQVYAAGKPAWPVDARNQDGYLVVFYNYYGEGDKMLQNHQISSYNGPMPCLFLPADSLPAELRQQLEDVK